MIAEIKEIMENYLNNRMLACIMVGTYKGGKVVLNEKSYVPKALLSGNMKGKLREGDKVRLLRNDRGKEYYILEIISVPYPLMEREYNCPSSCPYK